MSENVKPGDIIKFKRFAWRKRYSAMVVESVEDGFILGRKYRLTQGVEGIGNVILAVTSLTEIVVIGTR